MRFTPDRFERLKAGEPVTVQLKNTGATVHNFYAPELGVTTPAKVPPGKIGNVTFTAPSRPGTYQFVCNEPGHAEAGMVGRVVVE